MVLNTAALLVVLAIELNTNLDEYVQIQKASTAILSIASTQYAVSTLLYKDFPSLAEDIRYVDWVLTTPLLLFTYWKLAQTHGYASDYKILAPAVVSMIALGYAAEKGTRSSEYFLVSMLPYLYILYEIKSIQKMFDKKGLVDHSQLGNFFIYGWAVYPLAFYAPGPYKYGMYTVGDFVNKGVYSLMLYRVLENESTRLV